MTKRPDFKNFKEEVLKNEKVKAEYEALRPEFDVIMTSIANLNKDNHSPEPLHETRFTFKNLSKQIQPKES